ncbi:hypothetical protein [Paraburkholderia phenoliruptrix]|uniref:hypothetical protein n=1 Tax=Paraburkholderia phenoliruptrix TaxID=252970 RepID=UPI0034CF7F2C
MTEENKSCCQFTQTAGRSPKSAPKHAGSAAFLEQFLLFFSTPREFSARSRTVSRRQGPKGVSRGAHNNKLSAVVTNTRP